MKKIIAVSLLLLLFIACKKNRISPEGPTDIRIRNLSNFTLEQVLVITSERTGDTISLGKIVGNKVSDYFRFHKAYPKAQISATINIDGSDVLFSTGPVDYTYMQYIGQDKITYELAVSNINGRELRISNVIVEEPLVLK
jgi:hypothetical protein